MVKRIAKITGEENLQKAFKELFHVIVNLRAYSKEWEENYGYQAKRKKKFWEEKSDKLIEDLESGIYSPPASTKNETTIKPNDDVHRDSETG